MVEFAAIDVGGGGAVYDEPRREARDVLKGPLSVGDVQLRDVAPDHVGAEGPHAGGAEHSPAAEDEGIRMIAPHGPSDRVVGTS